MMAVNNNETPMAYDTSSRFALHAAPVAIAADTPQTDMSADITMFKLGESIFKTR
jgi:hypothetical protein